MLVLHRPRIYLLFGLRRFAETMKWHGPDLQPLTKCLEASFVATSADVSRLSSEIMISNRFTKALFKSKWFVGKVRWIGWLAAIRRKGFFKKFTMQPSERCNLAGPKKFILTTITKNRACLNILAPACLKNWCFRHFSLGLVGSLSSRSVTIFAELLQDLIPVYF